MNQTPKTEPNAAPIANDDPNSWLIRVKLLFERSVLACQLIVDFSKMLLAREQLAEEEKTRFKMLPTEMIVAMHNLRVGIEDALLGLAVFGLPADQREGVKKIFIEKKEDESVELDLLFEKVIEQGGPNGFLPAAKIRVPPESGVTTEQYLGSLDFLKEMAAKYQGYDFDNVPKAMEGACRKNQIADPFMKPDNPNESCSQLTKPQESEAAGIEPEELRNYQKMCEELIEDANMIYGQFCAVGSIYRAALQKTA